MYRSLHSTLSLILCSLAFAACSENTPTEPTTPAGDRASGELVATATNWTAKDLMPTGRVSLTAAVVTNALHQPVLYAIGGDNGNGVTLSTVEAYDFATNTWSTKASLPARLESTNGAGVIGGRIYVSGGRDLDNHSPGSDDGASRSSLYVYDPLVDRWTRKADMPSPSIGGVTGVIGGRLYVLDALSDRFYRYDPATDTWSVLPKCPGRHYTGATAVINNKLYVAGGVRSTVDGPIAINRLHVYDPVANRWSEKARMLHAVAYTAGARLLGQFYVIGGDSNNRGRDYVQAYDPVADTWDSKSPLPTFRSGLAASNFVNVNGKQRIVAIGGYGGAGDRWLKSNDVYAP